jgi:hypothetical protein
MFRLRQLGVVIAVVLCASTVNLKGQQPQASQQEVTVAPGPGWTFTPGVIAGGMYDSNVLVTTSVTDTGHPASDTYVTIDPTGSLKYRGKFTTFSADYRGTLRRYTTLDALDAYDQYAAVSFDRRASKRLTFFGSNYYSTAQTTDELNPYLSGVPFRRAGSQLDTLAAGLAYRLSEYSDWNVRYDFTGAHFNRETPDLTSGLINGIQTGIAHRLTTRLRVGVDGAYRFANMDTASTQTIQFVDGGGTMSYDLGQFTTVSASGGITYVDDQLNHVTRTGPYVRASISHTAAQAVFGTSYNQSFVPSFGFGGSTRSQQASGWIHLPPLGHRLYLQGSGSWGRTISLDNRPLQRHDTITLHSTVGYALSRQIRLQGVYIFTRQSSFVAGDKEVNRNRVGVELVLFNPMRIP